jgi:Bacterial membrane protein YfhO
MATLRSEERPGWVDGPGHNERSEHPDPGTTVRLDSESEPQLYLYLVLPKHRGKRRGGVEYFGLRQARVGELLVSFAREPDVQSAEPLMRRQESIIPVLLAYGTGFFVFFAPALFLDRQFGFRDAGHYYYPLNQRVQAEWSQGRWPLWEPEENAGMPLLGNPTAAVLYPGKLVFSLLPYRWAAKIYIVAHAALAFVNMLVLMRSWGTSWFAAGLSALAFSFGAPILLQCSNIIYLVGAAWLPLGVRAVDQWVRLGRRRGLFELVIVLSMQLLGGDPETAYLLGLASVGYALGLAWARGRPSAGQSGAVAPSTFGPWASFLWLSIALVAWFAATVAFAQWLPRWRGPGTPPPPLRGTIWLPLGVASAWALVIAGFLLYWRGRFWRYPLGAMAMGLAGSAALSAALTAIQLLPVIEFTQQTGRASGEGLHDMYQFSLEPLRLIEPAWPNFLGVAFEGKSYWGDVIRMPGERPTGWLPSYYLGGLTCALAIGSLAIRRGPPWRVWLTLITAVSLLASLGQYTSPIWIARAVADTSTSATIRSWLSELGPFDPFVSMPVRSDGYLHDGDGSLYWWMTVLLPGFRQFRFPAKLFTFTAFGISALAGLGWDRLGAGQSRKMPTVFFMLLGLTLITLVGVVLLKQSILASFRAGNGPTLFGPLESAAGYQTIVRSLAQAALVFGLGLAVTRLAGKRPLLAGSAALIVMTADLATANAPHMVTVPQAVFESKPEVLEIIEKAERASPSPGPFRIHRMPMWYPLGWGKVSSPNRVAEVAKWERDTLQPKHGITSGAEYTQSLGVAQLYEYDRYFTHFPGKVDDPRLGQALGIAMGSEVEYYPRRAYNMWNTRYFVVPFFANGWRDPARGSAAFVFQSALVYPPAEQFSGPKGSEEVDKWMKSRDFRVMRNLQEFPRAWVVHRARPLVASTAQPRWAISETMQEILYANDGIWNNSPRRVHDPRNVAWLAASDIPEVRRYLSGQMPGSPEKVDVTYPSPQQAVLNVTLDSPGLVILADVYYPGWQLTIDGRPAPVYKINGIMRGAAVSAGPHRLVYAYSPWSFRVGRLVSVAGLAGVLVLGLCCWRRPVNPVLASS